MKTNRDCRIDMTRCFCNYLVVGIHACTVSQFCGMGFIVRFLSLVVCYMSLPTLFFISGYLVASSCERMPFRDLVLRKAKRLLVPCFSWNLLLLLVYYCLDVYRDRVSWSWLYNPLASSLDGPLWFLRSLFCYALVAPALIWLMRRGMGLLLGIGLVGWIFFAAFTGIEQRLLLSFPSYSLVAFCLGVLCGTGPESVMNEVRAAIAEEKVSGQVFLPGQIPHGDLPRLLAHCNAAVIPSCSESFGHAFVEPMIAGLPILGTRVGAGEYVIREYETGYTFELPSPKSLQSGFRKMVERRAETKRMGETARKVARLLFSFEEVARTWHSVYLDLLGRGSD